MKKSVLFSTITFALMACNSSPQTQPADVKNNIVAELTETEKSRIDALTTEELVRELISTAGAGPDGQYLDEKLLEKLKAMEPEESAKFYGELPRMTKSSRYAFTISG